ncbi:MAG: phosphoribosylamine--glycine ligase [Ignavibacteria bacterium]|nr:phosphoribosylamine--glycine ligase [Ignavibacteria bacterium]
MNILLIGSGGREHALAHAISRSSEPGTIYAAPGNPGILTLAQHADITVTQHETVVHFCKTHHIDLVVIGPEQPLEAGLSDDLRDAGIVAFGPSRRAAQLETSKGFAKDFMSKYSIPTSAYRRFTAQQSDEAHEFICGLKSTPIVLKADGLAAGKGVIIAQSIPEAISALDEIFGGAFGAAGNEVVIEEFLHGEEASVFAICDGTNFITLAPAQDHKRAFDNDEGKNTGGMGAFAPAAIVTDEVLAKVEQLIIKPTLAGMKQDGNPFSGCLFVGLMIDNGEPNVVEYNCRFGDPETQAVLSVTEGDIANLFLSSALGNLRPETITNKRNGYACNVVIASGGYPDTFSKGYAITGIELAEAEGNVTVFHAGTALNLSGTLVTSGGRVLGVCGRGDTLRDAIDKAYSGAGHIDFTGKFYRKDIGKKGLTKEKL